MAVLLASSALIYAAFSPDLGSLALTGPVYEAAGIPDVYNSLEELLLTGGGSGNFADTSHMAQEKLLEVAESMLERLSAGLSNAARSLAVIGAVGLVVALVLGSAQLPPNPARSRPGAASLGRLDEDAPFHHLARRDPRPRLGRRSR